MLKLLLISLLATSCHYFEKNKKAEITLDSVYTQLDLKHQVLLYNAKEITSDRQGWFDEKCDALLFTALAADVPGIEVDIMQAFDGERWHRRPDFMPECYPDESKSTISRDMLTGVLWWAWQTKNIEVYTQLKDYGLANDWNFGDGERSRTVMTPQLMATVFLGLQEMTDVRYIEADIPLELIKNDAGYEAHLGVLHSLLRAEMYGFAPGYYIDYWKYHADRQPKNMLFQYAAGLYTTGDFTGIANNLLNSSHWPDHKYITSDEHCEPWLWQRDDGKSWQPCDKSEIHAGYDFLFLSNLILKETRR